MDNKRMSLAVISFIHLETKVYLNFCRLIAFLSIMKMENSYGTTNNEAHWVVAEISITEWEVEQPTHNESDFLFFYKFRPAQNA